MRKGRTICLVLLCLGLFLLAGCGSAAKKAENGAATEAMSSSYDYDVKDEAGRGEGAAPPVDGASTAFAAESQAEQKIIRNADLAIETTGIEALAVEIEKYAISGGGYLANSSQYTNSKNKLCIDLTVRIPSAKFDPFITWLEEKTPLKNKRYYTEDVTEQYIDLESRINNLTAQEKRLQAILEKATTVDELLKIERELERVRGEIESLTGRFKYLKNRVDFSTINISLTDKETVQSDVALSNVNGTWGNSLAALKNSVNTLLEAVSMLIIAAFAFLPYLIILGIAGLVFWNFRKKRRDKNEQA